MKTKLFKSLRSFCFSLMMIFAVLILPAVFPSAGFQMITTASAEEIPFALSGECGEDVSYSFNDKTGVLTISGTGAVKNEAFSGCSQIKEVVIKSGVTGVGYKAFFGCSNLESVTIEEGLWYLSKYSFSDCRSLKTVNLPSGLTQMDAYAFGYCDGLREITIPEGMQLLNKNVFYKCSALETVHLPATLIDMEFNAFDYCLSLNEFTVESENQFLSALNGAVCTKDKKTLIRWPMGKDFEVPSSVTRIGEGAVVLYAGESHILTIPETVQEIKKNAFRVIRGDYVGERVFPVLMESRDTVIADGAFFPGPENDFEDSGAIRYRIYDNSEKNVVKDLGSEVVSLKTGKILSLPNGFECTHWDSVDEKIVKVDQAGRLTSVKKGRTEVYAMSRDRVAVYTVIVGFQDVPDNAYYNKAVYWALDLGITGGVKNPETGYYDLFNPDGVCNRAQMVSFLWRMAGAPEPESKNCVFTDVKPGDYYYKAVLWGTENGIVGGYSDHTFRPKGKCTRQQAVTFLWRYYESPEPETSVSDFPDVTDKNAYYYKAVLWAAENGITGGYSDGTFKPLNECTRAQMVSFLYRSRK